MVMTLFWTIVIGIPFGVISAARQNSTADYGVRLFAIIGLSVPSFWVATLVLLIPAQSWGYAPPLNAQVSIFHAPVGQLPPVRPAVLGVGTRPDCLGHAAHPVVAARGAACRLRAHREGERGLTERVVVMRHALKNALDPGDYRARTACGQPARGPVIIEQIFNLRGLGQYTYASILQKDYNVAQTLVLFTASVAVLLNLAVDLLYGVFDPRIRYA